MTTVKIKYNGKRFPRIVNLRGGNRVSFLPNRMILELEEYDAMLLLKSNVRLQPEKWEFSFYQDAVDQEVAGQSEETQDAAPVIEKGKGKGKAKK